VGADPGGPMASFVIAPFGLQAANVACKSAVCRACFDVGGKIHGYGHIDAAVGGLHVEAAAFPRTADERDVDAAVHRFAFDGARNAVEVDAAVHRVKRDGSLGSVYGNAAVMGLEVEAGRTRNADLIRDRPIILTGRIVGLDRRTGVDTDAGS